MNSTEISAVRSGRRFREESVFQEGHDPKSLQLLKVWIIGLLINVKK